MDRPLVLRKHLALGLEAGIRIPELRRKLKNPPRSCKFPRQDTARGRVHRNAKKKKKNN